MAFKFNALTGQLDLVNSISDLNSRYVQKIGDTMSGDLDLQTNYLLFTDSGGGRWKLNLTTAGAVLTQVIAAPGISIKAGQPMGLANYGQTYAGDVT